MSDSIRNIIRRMTNSNKFLRSIDKRLRGSRSKEEDYISQQIEAQKSFEEYMKKKLKHFFVRVDPGPPGSREIMMKTFVLGQEDIECKINPHFFFTSGYGQVLDWLQKLEKYSFNLRTAGAIMELGCGSARLIRHLRCINGIRLVGTDIDAYSIEWCKRNVPGIEFHVNEPYPPLSFAEDGSFDLVLVASVFTHIPLDVQDLWIKEIHRVLRPGGYALCNLHGDFHEQRMLSAEDRERLRNEGHLIVDATDPRATLSTKIIGLCDVYMTRGEALKAFGSVFHILDFLPAGLDELILQKPLNGN